MTILTCMCVYKTRAQQLALMHIDLPAGVDIEVKL